MRLFILTIVLAGLALVQAYPGIVIGKGIWMGGFMFGMNRLKGAMVVWGGLGRRGGGGEA